MNFAAGPSEVLIIVESFPKRKERLVARLGTCINQNADLWVQNTPKCVE